MEVVENNSLLFGLLVYYTYLYYVKEINIKQRRTMLFYYENKEFEELSYFIRLMKPSWDNGRLNNNNIGHLCRDWLNISNSRSKELWTGKISKKAIDVYLHGNPRKVQAEHALPVQITLPRLFTEWYDKASIPNELEILYLTKFGMFNLTTDYENQQLKKVQTSETFISEQDSYNKVGIELVDCTEVHDYIFSKSPSHTNHIRWYHKPNIEKLNLFINN